VVYLGKERKRTLRESRAMRLLIVEDNEKLAGLLGDGLLAAGFDSDIVGNAGDARQVLATKNYSAVVLDLGLPDEDGLAVLRDLRQHENSLPVLVLTARSGVYDRVAGLRDGADDYLVKPFAFEELVARLQALLRRPGHLLARLLQVGNIAFDAEARQVYLDGKPQIFQAREIAVLEILMRRSGRVVPKQLVEDQLFGLASNAGSNAVEVYVHRLRKQLAEAGANVQIHTIRGVGYLIREIKP